MKCSSHQLELETSYSLLHPKLKVNLYTLWNLNLAQQVQAQLNSIFFFSSISELQLLSISEMGKSNTLPFTFGNWPFTITLTRRLRPKSDLSNERVSCRCNQQNIKNVTQRGVGQLRKNYQKILKFLPSKNKSFHSFQKVPKDTVPNKMAKK